VWVVSAIENSADTTIPIDKGMDKLKSQMECGQPFDDILHPSNFSNCVSKVSKIRLSAQEIILSGQRANVHLLKLLVCQ